MALVDIGVNLGHRRFDKDRGEVVARARAAGVEDIVCIGTSVEDSARALALAEEHGLWATVGVHPHDARHLDRGGLERLEELAVHPRCVAIGECGLDFDRDFSPRPAQEQAFAWQLELAARLGKPLYLHQRAAWERLRALLVPWLDQVPAAVAHCFTDGPGIARDVVELGLYVGITGWLCDERRSEPLKAALPEIPLARIMLETDAPFLGPRDFQGSPVISRNKARKRNEPAVLPWIAAAVARQKGCAVDEVAARTTATARELFG